jgi:hypothetical protein
MGLLLGRASNTLQLQPRDRCLADIVGPRHIGLSPLASRLRASVAKYGLSFGRRRARAWRAFRSQFGHFHFKLLNLQGGLSRFPGLISPSQPYRRKEIVPTVEINKVPPEIKTAGLIHESSWVPFGGPLALMLNEPTSLKRRTPDIAAKITPGKAASTQIAILPHRMSMLRFAAILRLGARDGYPPQRCNGADRRSTASN